MVVRVRSIADLKEFVEKQIKSYSEMLEELGYFDDDADFPLTFEAGKVLGAYEILLLVRKLINELEFDKLYR